MIQWYTGDVMFNMVKILLSIFSSQLEGNIPNVLTDDAQNMTGRYQGVVTLLEII